MYSSTFLNIVQIKVFTYLESTVVRNGLKDLPGLHYRYDVSSYRLHVREDSDR